MAEHGEWDLEIVGLREQLARRTYERDESWKEGRQLAADKVALQNRVQVLESEAASQRAIIEALEQRNERLKDEAHMLRGFRGELQELRRIGG